MKTKEQKKIERLEYNPIFTSTVKTNIQFVVPQQLLNEISQFGTVIVKSGKSIYRFENITTDYEIKKQLLK